MVRIVIVLGGEDLLIAADAEPLVRERQRAGRIGRQADLERLPPDVLGERALDRDERPALGVGQQRELDPDGVGVELPPEPLDRLRHGLRMGHEQEARQVDPVGRQRKQRAYGCPIHVAAGAAEGPILPASRFGRDSFAIEGAYRSRGRAGGQGEQHLSAGERHGRSPRVVIWLGPSGHGEHRRGSLANSA